MFYKVGSSKYYHWVLCKTNYQWITVQLLWKRKLSSEFTSANKVDSHCPQLCRPADLISSKTDNQVLTVNM